MDNQPAPQQVPFQAQPEVLKGVYTNNMQVAHTKEEFILDFMSMSNTPQAVSLVAKIFTSPGHFKRIVKALNENLKRYEDTFGAIADNTSTPTQSPAPSSTSDRAFGFDSKK